MITVLGRFIFRGLDCPVVTESLPSHIKFDELLQSEVIATKSIGQPPNRKTFGYKTNQLYEVKDKEVIGIVLLTIVEDTEVERPELEDVDLLNCLFRDVLLLPELVKHICWIT